MVANDLPPGLHAQLVDHDDSLRVAIWFERAGQPMEFKEFRRLASEIPFQHPRAISTSHPPAGIPETWPRDNLHFVLPALGNYLPIPLPGLAPAWDLTRFKVGARVIRDTTYEVPVWLVPAEHSHVVLRRFFRDHVTAAGPGFASPGVYAILDFLDFIAMRLAEGPILPVVVPLPAPAWDARRVSAPAHSIRWTAPVGLVELHQQFLRLRATKYIFAVLAAPLFGRTEWVLPSWATDSLPTRFATFVMDILDGAIRRSGIVPEALDPEVLRANFMSGSLARLHQDHGNCLHSQHPLFQPGAAPEGHLHGVLHSTATPDGTHGWEMEIGVLGANKRFLPLERMLADGTLHHALVEYDGETFRSPASIIERDWSRLDTEALGYLRAPEVLTGRMDLSERAGQALLDQGQWPGDASALHRWRRDRGVLGKLKITPAFTVAPARQGAASLTVHWELAAGDDEPSLHAARFVPTFEVLVGDEAIPEEEAREILKDGAAAFVRVHGRVVAREDLSAAVELLDARLKVLRRLDEPSGVSWHRVVELDDAWSLEQTSAAMQTVFSERWEAMLSKLRDGAGVPKVSPPKGFVGTLRPYQLRGLAWLAFMVEKGFGGCLADDMGLGKTVQVLALLALRRGSPKGRERTDLVVCPTAVVLNWEREARKFTPGLKVYVHQGAGRAAAAEDLLAKVKAADLVVTSYALVRRDKVLFDATPWGTVVVDEAQNLKNPDALQTRAVKALQATAKICLTGTPVENRLRDLWSIFDVALPGLLGGPTRFARTFQAPLRAGEPGAMQKLTRRVSPFLLRRTKADPGIAADLPPRQEQDTYCDLTREQVALYRAMTDATLGGIVGKDGIARRAQILTALLRFKQICNHPENFQKDTPARLFGRSGKLDRAMELVDELLEEGQKVLVFTQFTEMGRILQRAIAEKFDFEPDFYHGGLSAGDREDIVASFNSTEGPPVLIISLKAGGTGLNLTAASAVIHYDRWWNPAVEDQATDRAHRIGQTRKVNVYKFVTRGTLEERIVAMLESKRNLAAKVLGTSDESWITEMDDQALRSFLSFDDATEES